MYGEDLDLSLRLRLAGWGVGVVPAARVAHDYAFAKGDYKWFYLERNRWWTMTRRLPRAAARAARSRAAGLRAGAAARRVAGRLAAGQAARAGRRPAGCCPPCCAAGAARAGHGRDLPGRVRGAPHALAGLAVPGPGRADPGAGGRARRVLAPRARRRCDEGPAPHAGAALRAGRQRRLDPPVPAAAPPARARTRRRRSSPRCIPPSARAPSCCVRAGVALHAAPRPASRAREVLAAVRERPGLVPALAREPLLAWQVDVFWTALRPLALRAVQERPDVVLVEHDWAAAWAEALPGGPAARADPREPLVALLRGPRAGRGRRPGGRGPAARGAALRALRPPPPGRLRPARDDVRGRRRRRAGGQRQPERRRAQRRRHVGAARRPAGRASRSRIFTGTLAYPPNAEALLWLLRDLWPRIRARGARARACSSSDATRRRRRAGWPAPTTR